MRESVSRETSQLLGAYASELERWNKKINLVSPGDIAHLWDRHIADSLQVERVAPSAMTWLDLGSGGGFPAIPVATMRRSTGMRMTLVESDQRKGVFLRTISRILQLPFIVRTERAETLEALSVDVISARALAPLVELLGLCHSHAHRETVFVFPKGRQWKQEVDIALESWQFELDAVPSETQPGAAILRLANVRKQ